jgi:hypothetical protein
VKASGSSGMALRGLESRGAFLRRRVEQVLEWQTKELLARETGRKGRLYAVNAQALPLLSRGVRDRGA